MPYSDNKRIAKNTLLLYGRMALIMGIQLYTSRVVLQNLGQNSYGLYNVVGGLVVILTFVNGAMMATTQRFLSYELGRADYNKLRITFSQSVFAHFVIAILFLFIAETIGLWFLTNKMVIDSNLRQAAFWVFQFSVISFIISLMQVPFGALIMAYERLDVYAIIGVIEVFIKLCIAFLISYFTFNSRLIWYAFLILISTVTINMCYIIFCKKKYAETRLIYRIDKPIFKSLTSFAGWSIVGSLAWLGKNQGTNVILNLFFGTAINAAYGISMQINNAISSFVQNFTMSMNPQIIQSYAVENYSRTNFLMIIGSKYSFMLLFLLTFPIIVVMDDILKLWLTEVPSYTGIFSKLILIITLCESFAYVIGTAIQATGKIRTYQIIVGFTLLSNLPISYLLLKYQFPPYSVLICGIFISIIALIERIFIINRQLEEFSIKKFIIKSIWPSFKVTFISIAIFLIISKYIEHINPIFRFIVSFLIVASSELIFGIDRNEKKYVTQIIKKVINQIWIK